MRKNAMGKMWNSVPVAIALVTVGVVGASPAIARPIVHRYHYQYGYNPLYMYAPGPGYAPGPYMYAPGGSWGYPDPTDIRGTVLDEEEHPSNYRH